MQLIFKNKAIADTLLKEIVGTPDGVILYATSPTPDFGFDGGVEITYDAEGMEVAVEKPNVVSYTTLDDGKCSIAHQFSELDVAWLEAFLDAEIASGDVVIS